MKPSLKPLLWMAALIMLALTFMAYLQPGLVMDVATRLWSCF